MRNGAAAGQGGVTRARRLARELAPIAAVVASAAVIVSAVTAPTTRLAPALLPQAAADGADSRLPAVAGVVVTRDTGGAIVRRGIATAPVGGDLLELATAPLPRARPRSLSVSVRPTRASAAASLESPAAPAPAPAPTVGEPAESEKAATKGAERRGNQKSETVSAASKGKGREPRLHTARASNGDDRRGGGQGNAHESPPGKRR